MKNWGINGHFSCTIEPNNFLFSNLQLSDLYLLILAAINKQRMFFIGGLNSILPYIIYLSLIWVFLIVGFSGKIMEVWQLVSPQPHYANNDALHSLDNKVIHYYDLTTVLEKHSVQKDLTVIPRTYPPPDIKDDPGEYTPVLSYEIHYYSSFGFRGPPSSFLFL